jgi:hypothetical protein
MGLADIAAEALQSKAVRQAIGERVFKSSLQTPQQGQDQDGNQIINWLWNAAGRLGNFLVSSIGGLTSFTLTGLWSLFVSTRDFIWNFDWNMSDESIDQQIQQYWNNILGMLGGTLGNLFGYLACGVAPAATIAVFNEPLGAYVMKNVAEEMAEEFLGNLAGLVRYTFMSGVQMLILLGFKNVRKWIKNNSAMFGRIFGNKAEAAIKAWGEKGSKPWSFAIALDNAVESIPNEGLRNFVEEFLEEAWDGCVEAGYVVANSIDSYLAAEKLKQQIIPPMGDTKYVEIKPDRSIDDQRIILAGPSETLKPVIVQTLTNYQMMEDINIGSFVGSPIDEVLRAKPLTIAMRVQFYSVQQPPWYKKRGEDRLVSGSYHIPDVDPKKLDWDTIKLACGGVNGYMYGRFRATGRLDNGRQMAVYANSKDEAIDQLVSLISLSKAKLVERATISEDRREDAAGRYLKQPVRVYPAFFSILNQYQVPGAPGSSIPIEGKRYMRKQEKIDLWVEKEPPGFDDLIRELLRKPGAEQD